jgi:hypothetical protein
MEYLNEAIKKENGSSLFRRLGAFVGKLNVFGHGQDILEADTYEGGLRVPGITLAEGPTVALTEAELQQLADMELPQID